MKEQELIVLDAEKHLKKDEIINKVSRFIKRSEFISVGGMMEVSSRDMEEINTLLFELNKIEDKIAGLKI